MQLKTKRHTLSHTALAVIGLLAFVAAACGATATPISTPVPPTPTASRPLASTMPSAPTAPDRRRQRRRSLPPLLA